MRGGVSHPYHSVQTRDRSSPRAWGCFYRIYFRRKKIPVFPTCVGVFLVLTLGRFYPGSLPHVRGGVSDALAARAACLQSSPRAWGCFFMREHEGCEFVVFPTCVGVFPSYVVFQTTEPGLPHVRGGVSSDSYKISPGCSLPHVRGGVSKIRAAQDKKIRSSPRAWGCFSMTDEIVAMMPVFPTCVGVFPVFSCSAGLTRTSSPRAWGCFFCVRKQDFSCRVFPTCVGVFPPRRARNFSSKGLPHVRGGVSFTPLPTKRILLSSPRAWGCF